MKLRLSRKENPDRVVELDLSKRLHVFTGEVDVELITILQSAYRGVPVSPLKCKVWSWEVDEEPTVDKLFTTRGAHHFTALTVDKLGSTWSDSRVVYLQYPGACTMESQMVELVGSILGLCRNHYVILWVNNTIVLDTIKLYVYLSEMRDFMRMTVAERFQVLQNANWSISDNSHLLVKDWDAYWYKRVSQEGLPLRSDIELPEEKVGFYLVRKEKVSEIHLGGWLPPSQVCRSLDNLIDVITDDLYLMEDD